MIIKHFSKNQSVALIMACCSLLIIFSMLHHPSIQEGSTTSLSVGFSNIAFIGKVVHGAIIFLLLLLLYAFVYFSGRLQAMEFDSVAALIAFFGGSIAFIIAAAINGFILPSLAVEVAAESLKTQETFRIIAKLCMHTNQFFAMFGVILSTSAIALWSVSLVKLKSMNKVVGGLGLTFALATFVWILTGNLILNINGMTVVTIGFCSWYLCVALLLWKNTLRCC